MIIPNKKYKIALIGYRLSGGGSDKVMANLSIFFEKSGIEVHTIIILDEVSFQYSGTLVNLGVLKNKSNGLFNKVKRLHALQMYLKSNNFDFIIDFRFRTKPIQELVLSRIIYNAKTIFTVHSFLIDHYMPKASWLTRLMYNYCYANVAIVDEMSDLILQKHNLKNVVTIANPINLDEVNLNLNEEIDCNFEYIIAVGQYENQIKQFDKLIVSYAHSILPKNKMRLLILGNGDHKKLKKVACDNNVEDFVDLLGYQNNPFKYLKRAKFSVLCSKNEGLPNVILESLACGTPVVSFDCPSGPKEIIRNHQNGILVENQNFEKLTQAINLMINDTDLYQRCKQNAVESIHSFSLDKIGKQWLNLMNITPN